ncbi:MAG: glycoside hydrolase family 2, partial [Blautia sp.]|nr:glycoside hydrolase family 2 [Blautia sp.]
ADGRELARNTLSSASGRVKICARPEQDTVKPGQVVYIPVTLEGENGVVESNQDRKLKVSVKGGRLLGFGSANPCTEEQYHTGAFTTWYGRALAVVRVEEDCVLTVTDGKEYVEAAIRSVPQ